MRFARYIDLVVLALALPVFLLADLPLVGYAAIAAAWIAQFLVLTFAESRVKQALARGERRPALGIMGGSILVRLWIVTGAVLAVGLIGEREDGLAAAVMAAVLITVHLVATAVSRVLDPEQEAS
jgi:hypothetical protein